MLKGKTLLSPASSQVRPTSDKVRAAIFSSLADHVDGAEFLDLFAGTGSVGVEAYSRGAKHITFVENHPQSLYTNIKLIPKGSTTVIAKDIFKSPLNKQYDIIFADPPYGKYTPHKVLSHIFENELLAPDGVIVYEESSKTDMEAEKQPFLLIRERKYGDTLITYWEYKI